MYARVEQPPPIDPRSDIEKLVGHLEELDAALGRTICRMSTRGLSYELGTAVAVYQTKMNYNKPQLLPPVSRTIPPSTRAERRSRIMDGKTF